MDRLASGMSADIYRAYDTLRDQVVIIKRLRPEAASHPLLEEGFRQEVGLAMRVDHPNVVRGHEAGEVEGSRFLVMDIVDGPDLGRVLERASSSGRTVSLAAALHVVGEVLRGLRYLQGLWGRDGRPLHLVHRDLCPRNVLLGYDGSVRISDLGTAHSPLAQPTPRVVIGSLGYISPEQARLEPLDERSDIFAVGCVLFELLAGYPAFPLHGCAAEEALRRHQRAYLGSLPERVGKPARQVVETACHPDRGARFRDASAMLSALTWLREQARCEPSARALEVELGDLFSQEIQRAASRDPRATGVLLG
jgi:serine/threonine-protein kinase